MEKVSKEYAIEILTLIVTERFRTFGGGKKSSWGNPIAEALKDSPAQFAAGVNVQEVVETIVQYLEVIVDNPELIIAAHNEYHNK